jgi:zinc/manganese transport system substrate-binding protein/manganese/iron transport system substrate-binding protein
MQRAILLLFILLTACVAPNLQADSPVLASTSFLADITRNIAGDRVHVESLLPTGTDPHSYQPTPQDVAKIERSRLLILNGAGYEHFLEPLLDAQRPAGEREVIEASAGLPLRRDPSSGHGNDPHLWLDPNHVIFYVEIIRDALTHFDPDGAAIYQSNAEAYTSELKDLDAWIVQQVRQIPVEKRLLVTNHEALGYFAERYGFVVSGTVSESVSSDASPSAQQIAALVDQITASGAPAIFLDVSDNPALARQIADETGVKVVTTLYLESLTEGPPASTYIDMMKHNVSQIVEGLQGASR